jgi:hypothetical protein
MIGTTMDNGQRATSSITEALRAVIEAVNIDIVSAAKL